MTHEHNQIHDLLAAVAIGAATPEETRRVEAHAAECVVCRDELDSFRHSVDILAVSVPQHQPPPQLKASVMREVRADAALAGGLARARTPQRSRRGFAWNPLARWQLAAAMACVAALALLGWNVSLRDSSSPAAQAIATSVVGTPDAPQINGRLVYVPSEDTAVLRLENLPPLSPRDAYQVWVLADGQAPKSVGLLLRTGPTDGRIIVTGLKHISAIALTAQPPTNRSTPEGPILMSSELRTT